MAIFTVYVPDEAPDLVTRADRTAFIREGFNIWAFLFGVLFLLRHRLWIAAAVWIAAVLALVATVVVFHPPVLPCVALAVLMRLFLGVEGNDLRRWGLERRGFRVVDLVSGAERDDAELIFFSRQPPKQPEPKPVQRWTKVPPTTPSVIGMFPEGGGL